MKHLDGVVVPLLDSGTVCIKRRYGSVTLARNGCVLRDVMVPLLGPGIGVYIERCYGSITRSRYGCVEALC